jgi:hypothetical protein
MSQIQLQDPASAIIDDLIVDGNTGSASPSADVLNIVGTGAVSTAASGNTVTISVAGGGFSWNVVTSADNIVPLVPNNGYIPKGGPQVIFQLPATANIGDTYKIVGYSNLWELLTNGAQTISLSSPGATTNTSVTATNIDDSIELMCVTTNIEFRIINCTGNLSFA